MSLAIGNYNFSAFYRCISKRLLHFTEEHELLGGFLKMIAHQLASDHTYKDDMSMHTCVCIYYRNYWHLTKTFQENQAYF